MSTQRFYVGVSASPAERTVKDSAPAFPLWPHVPAEQGLFDPRHEKDSCGVGFIVDIKGRKSHKIVVKVDVNGSGQWEDKTYAVKAREVYNSPKPDAAGTKTGRQ